VLEQSCEIAGRRPSLFADVDPRQCAAALKLAAGCSEQYGFQYICCMNAGSLPTQHLGGAILTPIFACA
jgi:uncharacterized protein YydD (DUF2326 family)